MFKCLFVLTVLTAGLVSESRAAQVSPDYQFFDKFSLASDTTLGSVSWVALGDFSQIGWSINPNQTQNLSVSIYTGLGTAPIFTQIYTPSDYTTSSIGPLHPGSSLFTAGLSAQLQAGQYWISFFGEQSPMAIGWKIDLAGSGFNSIEQYNFVTGQFENRSGGPGFSLNGDFSLNNATGDTVFQNPGTLQYEGFCSPCSNFILSPPISNAVPEPSTWAMLLIGFAGIGFAAYRKRRHQSRALYDGISDAYGRSTARISWS
jgi:hypothetical protein